MSALSRSLTIAVLLGSAAAFSQPADAATSGPSLTTVSPPAPQQAAAAEHEAHPLREHRLHLALGASAMGYLSDTRTMGGVGPSVGVRDVFREVFLIEVDASYLFMIGNVVALRGGFGVQLPGFWSPAATANVTVLLGDRFSFLQPGQGLPLGTPTLGLGVTVSPLRFQTGPAIISALGLGLSFGTELNNWGPLINASLLEIAVPL